MKKLIFPILFPIFLLTVLGMADGQAADYNVSPNTTARERALDYEATRAGKTKHEVLQELVDQYLDDRINRLKEAREKILREGYDALSPTDKKTVDKLIPKVP